MAILDKYRRAPDPNVIINRRSVIFAAMLLLAAVLFFCFRTMLRREAPPQPAEPVATIGPAAPAAPHVLKPWNPLSPAEERALYAGIVDQQPLYVREHRDAYYYLLGKVHSLSDSDLEAQTDRTVKYADYANQSAIIRGSVVEVVGRLLRLDETPLSSGTAAIPAVFEGQILDRENHIYTIILTERPSSPYLPGRIRVQDGLGVRFCGMFLQVVVYENRETPPRRVASPLLVGRRLALAAGSAEAAPPLGGWPWLLTALLAAILIGCALFRLGRPQRRPRLADEDVIWPGEIKE